MYPILGFIFTGLFLGGALAIVVIAWLEPGETGELDDFSDYEPGNWL